MIVILTTKAQNAASSLELEYPPSLTINADFGAFTLEGSKYTSSSKRGKPKPYWDSNIPVLEENDVVLVRKLDLSTIAGLMRARGQFIENLSFWEIVEDTLGKESSPLWIPYNGILSWIKKNDPCEEISDFMYLDITDFYTKCYDFIKEALDGGSEASKLGHEFIEERKELDKRTFYKSYPQGLVCRKTEGEYVNDLFSSGEIICTYDICLRSITLSSKHERSDFSCKEIASHFWGSDSWGDALEAGSPDYRALGEGEYIKVISYVVNKLSKL